MTRFLLIVILIVAVILRVSQLSTNPPGFFCDEVSVGYNAYLIAHTGKDEWQHTFPIFFKAFGEYRNPLEVYSAIPAVELFGISPFAVRITSAIFSTGTVLSMYLIGSIMNPWLGLILAAITTITPWSVHIGRTGFVAENIYLFCISVSLYCLLRSKDTHRYIIFFFISCVIGIYSYFSAYIIYPFIVVGGIIYLWQKSPKKYLFAGLILFYAFTIPLSRHIWKGDGIKRYEQVSLLHANSNPIHKFALSYVLHFSPDYLFVSGDTGSVTRHSFQHIGQFYVWGMPGLLLGVYFVWKRKTGIGRLLVLLLIIYPIPSSITSDITPLATRSIMGIVPFTYLIGYGYFELTGVLKRRVNTLYAWILICFLSFVFIVSGIHIRYKISTYGHETGGYEGWQYGMKESIVYLKEHEKEYDMLYITHRFNSPRELLQFYNRTYNCQKCRIMPNPIVIDRYHKQLYAIRKEDIEEAYQQYEDVEFVKLNTIRDPGKIAQLFIGYFIFTSTYSEK